MPSKCSDSNLTTVLSDYHIFSKNHWQLFLIDTKPEEPCISKSCGEKHPQVYFFCSLQQAISKEALGTVHLFTYMLSELEQKGLEAANREYGEKDLMWQPDLESWIPHVNIVVVRVRVTLSHIVSQVLNKISGSLSTKLL